MVNRSMDETLQYKEAASIETAKCFWIEISAHNDVGLHVGKGVDILALECSAKTKKLIRRDLILASPCAPLEKLFKSPNNAFLWGLTLKGMTELSQNPDSLGIFPRTPAPAAVVAYKFSAQWCNVCYLAILTSLGAVNVYQNVAGHWVSVCDVSEQWVAHCARDLKVEKTADAWQAQLQASKLAAICWVQRNGTIHASSERGTGDDESGRGARRPLYLVTVTMSGDVVVFGSSGDKFGLALKVQLPSGLKEPCNVHAFQVGDGNEDLCVVVGTLSGLVTALLIDVNAWQLVASLPLFTIEDWMEPQRIVSVWGRDGVTVVTSQARRLTAHCLAGREVRYCEAKQFPCSAVGLAVDSGDVLVTLSNGSVVKVSAPGLAELGSWTEGQADCDYSALSPNGALLAVAQSMGHAKSRIVILGHAAPRQADDLAHAMARGVPASHLLDLLWLHKVSFIKDKKLLDDMDSDVKCLKLRYWELQLTLTDDCNDEKLRHKINQRIKALEKALLEPLHTRPVLEMSTGPCVVCGAAMADISLRSLRCVKGHNVARCCRTLQPCPSYSYAVCVLCDAQTADDGLNELCPYCSGFFRITVSVM